MFPVRRLLGYPSGLSRPTFNTPGNSDSLMQMKDKFKQDVFSNMVRQYYSTRFSKTTLFEKLLELKRLKASKIREQTMRVIKNCCEQCEFVIAHRVRRSQQIFSLYVKWWGDTRLKVIVEKLQQCILRKRSYIAYSLSSAPLFSWNDRRIPDDELLKYEGDVDRTKRLISDNEEKENTEPTSNSNFQKIRSECSCNRCQNDTEDSWDLFYSNDCIRIWRREHTDHKGEGVYVYKVYGKFDDVTAKDFFQVQIDTEYRKEWDSKSVQLYIVDSEPQSSSDIVYWEFLFPKMFYNRDYVYNRRYKIDENNKVMIIMNESISHPACPERPPIYRVKEYWSHMVIKPTEDFDKPGIEFSVTYFDNPGVSVPNYLTAWYTVIGMPEYLMQQRTAAKVLAERRTQQLRVVYNVEETPTTKLIRTDGVAISPKTETSYVQKDNLLLL